ncbi:MAG: hypothetical protein Kow0069_30860 [Promethearchaeota archaeon]
MTVVVVADEETCIGFSLIGLKGIVVTPQSDFEAILEEILADKDVKVVIVGEQAFMEHEDFIHKVTQVHKTKVVVPVPSIRGDHLGDYLGELVNRMVGAI